MDFDVKVSDLTEAGVQCVRMLPSGKSFWLSLKSCEWNEKPRPGCCVRVGVPDWLIIKHRQLVGDEEFEQAKQSKHERSTTMAEQRELSGTLSRNTKRENEKQPEFRGTATIGGVAYRISAWVKEGDSGKFFSLAFSPKEAQQGVQSKPSAPPATYKAKTLNDDFIPF